MQASLKVALKKGEEKPFQKGFPWIFSNQLASPSQLVTAEPGALAQLTDARGTPLGLGLLSPSSLIAWRELQRGPAPALPGDWLYTRLNSALTKRQKRYDVPYFRWVHAEADGLPGLVIDRFDAILVVQIGTVGMDRLWPDIQEALLTILPDAAILLRNDIGSRAKEGLPQEVRQVAGAPIPPRLEVEEYGVRFLADLWHGQKTGWFYDQRDNRAMAAQMAHGKRVADVFSHSGGFGIPAAVAGAREVWLVDASALALDMAMQAAALNGVTDRLKTQQGDAFQIMQQWAEAGEMFDLVIADPPAFIPQRAHLPQGLRAYEKTTRLAAALVAPGGHLAVASCSHHCTAALLKRAVLAGVKQAGRNGKLLRMTGAAADHPLHPQLPQSGYLHCAWLELE